jgi:hypothetical protein
MPRPGLSPAAPARTRHDDGPLDFAALWAKQRAIRAGFPETMGPASIAPSADRLRRASGDDTDARFVFVIAFNAAYADR